MPPWTLPALAGAMWIGILAGHAAGLGAGQGRGVLAVALGVVGMGLATAVHRGGGPGEARSPVRAGFALSLVVLSFACLGAGWAGVREARVRASPLATLAGHVVEMIASVQEVPAPGELGWTATVRVDTVAVRSDRSGRGFRVADSLWIEGRGRAPDLRLGDRLHIQGTLAVPEGSFGAWLVSRGYPATLTVDRLERLGPATDPVRRAANAMRYGLGSSLRRVFSSRDAGLMMGLALGDTSRLDPSIEEDFRATGLSHLTAVSGENLAMFLGPIMGLAGLVRLGRRGRLAVGLGATAFFMLLTGGEPSVLRAAAMAGLTMLGIFLGRPRSAPAVLGGAVLLLLAVNPTIVHSIGFQLSVGATAGMALLAQPLADHMSFLPRSLALAAGTTISAQAGVGPLLLYYFGLVPVVSLPANLLAFPAVSPAMLLGLLAGALAALVPALGGGVAVLARIPLHYLVSVAHHLARLPLPSITSSGGGAAALVAGIGVVIGAGVWVRRGARVPRPALVAAALVIPVFVWSGALRGGPPGVLTLTFFDVGQGDAALVRSPAGAAILVDGGPDPQLVARKLSSLGVRKLEVVIATHPHADHVAGLPAVLSRFPVGLVLEPGCRAPSPAYEDFLRAVGAAGVTVEHPRTGMVLAVGDLRLEFLGPTQCFHGTNSDPNNDSLVFRLRDGEASALFPGDAEEPAQTELIDHEAEWLAAPVLKVPHHGGATTLGAFLIDTRAAVAVVSVGPNRYGHPSADILAELAHDGMRVFRTDRCGDVTVTFQGGGVMVSTGG